MSALIGKNRKGNALLCRAWGETDLPVVQTVYTTAELVDFIVETWLGSRDNPEMESVIKLIERHDFSADDASSVSFELEIGGATFEDVFGRFPRSSSAEFERVLDAYNHTRQWNAERWERLSSWARSSLTDDQQKEFFSILANGVKDAHENPTGAQMINTLKRALRDINEQIDRLRSQGWL